MKPNGFHACLLREPLTMPSNRSLAEDNCVFGLTREYLTSFGGILGHEFFDVRPNRVDDRVGAITVRGLGASEDDFMGIVFDASTAFDVKAIVFEIAPAQAKAFGDAESVIK